MSFNTELEPERGNYCILEKNSWHGREIIGK